MEQLKFYFGLQGNKTPNEYIRIAKKLESSGFSRVYVYDDLFYYPSFPILTTIAQHTKKIQLGPCLVNGFYRHPAIIASNYAYLDKVSNSRAVLGLGRGAFYDLLKMETDETVTREAYEETIKLIHHFNSGLKTAFKGAFFNTTEKAFLKIPRPQNPYIITATWNYNMAWIAGKYGNELQIAEVWNEHALGELYYAFIEGNKENKHVTQPEFSIGGMMCLANTEKKAVEIAKKTVSVYLPYLRTILNHHNIDFDSGRIQRIVDFSKSGEIEKAADLLKPEEVKALALVGTPDQIAEKINNLRNKYPINGLLISPPYGHYKTITRNIELIEKELFPRL